LGEREHDQTGDSIVVQDGPRVADIDRVQPTVRQNVDLPQILAGDRGRIRRRARQSSIALFKSPVV
jgi:hypothetical protein